MVTSLADGSAHDNSSAQIPPGGAMGVPDRRICECPSRGYWWRLLGGGPNSGLIGFATAGSSAVGLRTCRAGSGPIGLRLLFPVGVTFWLPLMLPESPTPTVPPPELSGVDYPIVPSGVVIGVQEPGAGGVGGPLVDETEGSGRRTGRNLVNSATLPRRRWADRARSHPSARRWPQGLGPLSSTRVTPSPWYATRPSRSWRWSVSRGEMRSHDVLEIARAVPATVTVDRP